MLTRGVHWLHTEGPGMSLIIARIVMGIFWLAQITWKPPPTFGCPDQGFCLWINKEMQYPLIPLYATFLSTLVAPYIFIWGWVTTLVETAIGISFLLGAFTRLGGAVSILWSINLFIGISGIPGEYPPAYIMMALLGIIFMLQ